MENHICPNCFCQFVNVVFLEKKSIEKVCPNCTELISDRFEMHEGVFYERSSTQQTSHRPKDGPIRWFKRVILNRY